jgi:hypothetical protein
MHFFFLFVGGEESLLFGLGIRRREEGRETERRVLWGESEGFWSGEWSGAGRGCGGPGFENG